MYKFPWDIAKLQMRVFYALLHLLCDIDKYINKSINKFSIEKLEVTLAHIRGPYDIKWSIEKCSLHGILHAMYTCKP